MSNVKAGDMAVIFRCALPDVVGTVVEVMTPVDGDRWWVKAPSPVRCVGHITQRQMGHFKKFLAYDSCLRPIRGEPETQDKQLEATT